MKAWIEKSAVRDICPGNPDELYHPDIARLYDTEVPKDTKQGATKINGVWTNPVVPEPDPVPPAPVVPPKVSAITYKMLFTSAERIAAKISTNPVIVDLQDLLNDPRTTHVDLSLKLISDALDYMTSIGILANGRKAEILTGEVK